jgi:hypothetical protein
MPSKLCRRWKHIVGASVTRRPRREAEEERHEPPRRIFIGISSQKTALLLSGFPIHQLARDKPGRISSISNISRISMTEDPGIGLGQRLTHSIASSRSFTLQIQ